MNCFVVAVVVTGEEGAPGYWKPDSRPFATVLFKHYVSIVKQWSTYDHTACIIECPYRNVQPEQSTRHTSWEYLGGDIRAFQVGISFHGVVRSIPPSDLQTLPEWVKIEGTIFIKHQQEHVWKQPFGYTYPLQKERDCTQSSQSQGIIPLGLFVWSCLTH